MLMWRKPHVDRGHHRSNNMTTYNKKRIVAVHLLLFFVLSAANYYLSLGIFPRFAKLIMIFGMAMLLVYIVRFAPTREEFEEYRKKKRMGGK